MKKLLSIAIAAAVAAPMAVSADTTLYGLVDNSIRNVDNGTYDAWDISSGNNTGSRIGVKGDEDLGNGLKAIFTVEWGIDTADAGAVGATRQAFVGLNGGFGTVAVGHQYSPYYKTVGSVTNNANLPGTRAWSNGTVRLGSSIAYISPNFNGFEVWAGAVADNSVTNATYTSADATELGLKYANGPLTAGIAMTAYDDNTAATGSGDVWGLVGKYNFGNFMVGAMYEDVDNTTGTTDGGDSWGLIAEAYFGNNTVIFQYGELDANTVGSDIDEFNIELQHNFSKRTAAYVGYNEQDNETAVDTSQFGIGLRHSF